MAVNLSPVGGVAAQFFTSTGAVLTGGKLYTYAAGTTTPAVTYTTSSGSTPWTNPVVLDAAGRVPGSGEIWLTDGIIYKFVLKDSNDVLIATYDNITGINSNAVAYTNQQEIVTATAGQTVFNLGISYAPGTNSLSVFVDGVNQYGPGAQYSYVETDSTTVTFNSGLHVGAEVKFTTTQQQGAGAVDASQVSYDPPFTGSVATNVEAKLAQYVSVKDFGAVGDGITDDTDAVKEACKSGYALYWPAGTYLITQPINYKTLAPTVRQIFWFGDGAFFGTTIKYTGTGTFLTTLDYSTNPDCQALIFKDIYFQGDGVVGHTSRNYSGYVTTTSASAGSTSAQTAIEFQNEGTTAAIFENCRFKFWNLALEAKPLTTTTQIRNCVFQSLNIGLKIGATVTTIQVTKTEFAGCAAGVWFFGDSGTENIQLSECVFQSNRAGAAVLSTGGCAGLTINDNYWTDNVDDFIHIGYNPVNATTNGFLNKLDFYNNFGGSLNLGDTVRIVNIYRNALDSTAGNSVRNSYTYQPPGVNRRISEWDNYDAFGPTPYTPYTNFDGGSASEIIHYNPGTRVYRSSALSLTTGADTAIPFDAETYDDCQWHSITSNTSRVTVDRYGKYTISGSAVFANTSATGVRSLSIRINGTTLIAINKSAGSTAFSPAVNVTATYKLAPNDYVELVATQDSGGSLDVLAGTGYYPEFSVQLC